MGEKVDKYERYSLQVRSKKIDVEKEKAIDPNQIQKKKM